MSFATSFAEFLSAAERRRDVAPSAIVMSALTLTMGSISRLSVLARHCGS
jgi:hypothetical protein